MILAMNISQTKKSNSSLKIIIYIIILISNSIFAFNSLYLFILEFKLMLRNHVMLYPKYFPKFMFKYFSKIALKEKIAKYRWI